MRYVNRRQYPSGMSPRVAPFVMQQPGVVTVQAAGPAAAGQTAEYESVFKPSQLAQQVFGDRPTRTRVYSVRFSSVAGSATGLSTQVNFQKGGIIKDVRGSSSNANTASTTNFAGTTNSVWEILLRYGNQDPIFTDYVRADALFGVNCDSPWLPRPPLIILPQNSVGVLINNLLTTTVTTINIAFTVEEPAY